MKNNQGKNLAIGFYLDFSATGISFDYEQYLVGNLAVSGTISSTIRVIDILAKNKVAVTLFTSGEVCFPNVQITLVDSPFAAVKTAEEMGLNIFLFTISSEDLLDTFINAAKGLRLKLMAWVHNPLAKPIRDKLYKSQNIIRVITVSKNHYDGFRDHPIISKAIVIPNGLVLNLYEQVNYNNQELTVCYIGALERSKGFHHLAKAWPLIKAAIPKSRLIVVGSGRLYNNKANTGPLGLTNEGYENDIIEAFGVQDIHGVEKLGVVLLD